MYFQLGQMRGQKQEILWEACCVQNFSGFQPAKFYPGIFPRIFFVCKICIDPVRFNKKTHSSMKFIFSGDFCGFINKKSAFSRNNIMKENDCGWKARRSEEDGIFHIHIGTG